MPSTPTSTTSARSSARPAAGSRRSAASATGWPMPDETPDAAEAAAAEGDARLIRSGRSRLLAWSGGSTLLGLLGLRAALYLTLSNTLEANGSAGLVSPALHDV